jgi:NADPH-dependent 2,4-dienoyl-CoA reductase/sulfur reductase-like enzyme
MAADLPRQVDVVIVGAGPAGLAAAAALRSGGIGSVLVLDREPEAGGIPRHCGHSPYGMREFRRLMRGPAYALRLLDEAQKAGAKILTGVTVTALQPGPRITVTSDAGPAEIGADQVLLATGAREGSRAARLLGGTKPGGVLSTGALQGLVYLDRMRPCRKPVVLGTELVSFSALLTCRHAGIRPVAMVEPGERTTARWPAPLLPRLLGVPLLLRTEIVAIEGRDWVESVVVRSPEGERRIETDGVIVTGKFRPEAALAWASHLRVDPRTGGPEVDQFGRCSDPSYLAAGNLLRTVETAGRCWAEGRAVARSILLARAHKLPEGPGSSVQLDGDALAWVMPQRLARSDGAHAALPKLQLRARRAARGRLALSADGHEISGGAADLLPERRLELPLPTAGSTFSVSFSEAAD